MDSAFAHDRSAYGDNNADSKRKKKKKLVSQKIASNPLIVTVLLVEKTQVLYLCSILIFAVFVINLIYFLLLLRNLIDLWILFP